MTFELVRDNALLLLASSLKQADLSPVSRDGLGAFDRNAFLSEFLCC